MSDTNINIMMFGGRRCGKTSVLAVMVKYFDKLFGGTNLTIKPISNITELNDKFDEMRELYAEKDVNTRFTPDDNMTLEKSKYMIELSLKSKSNGKINFNFIDIPGEWLQNGGHENELKEIVESSSVILVAIDTPFLMEEAPDPTGKTVGRYNEKRNHSGAVCDYLKSLKLDKEEKMVIFVPLKCEKYIHEKKMTLVNLRVHTAYGSFFQHIQNINFQKRCTSVIAPIATFGTVEFARFERDENGIILDPEYKTPKSPLYRFTDKADSAPDPMYCEQPLLYILLYVLRCAAAAKEKGKNHDILSWLFASIGEVFFNMASAGDFMKEEENIHKLIKVSGDGYEIITDPFDLKGKN